MLREINGFLTYAIIYTFSMVAFGLMALWFCRRRKVPLRSGIVLTLCYIWSMNTGARILYDILNNRFD